MHKGSSEYKGEVLLCHYFSHYWIDLRLDETFVQFVLTMTATTMASDVGLFAWLSPMLGGMGVIEYNPKHDVNQV